MARNLRKGEVVRLRKTVSPNGRYGKFLGDKFTVEAVIYHRWYGNPDVYLLTQSRQLLSNVSPAVLERV